MSSTENSSPASSPLSGENPDSISELFNRPRSSWTEEDLVRMVEKLRAYRASLGNLDEPQRKKAATPKVDVSGITNTNDLLAAIGLGGPLGGAKSDE